MTDVYWDSGVFLAWLLPETERIDRCKSVLDAAEDGRLRIVTSSLALVEVIHLKGAPKMNEKSAETISNFFKHPYIVVRNVDRKIAEMARILIWQRGIKPKDSIHLATAIDARIDTLHTFDDELVALSGQHGAPTIVIRYPDMPTQLPLPES